MARHEGRARLALVSLALLAALCALAFWLLAQRGSAAAVAAPSAANPVDDARSEAPLEPEASGAAAAREQLTPTVEAQPPPPPPPTPEVFARPFAAILHGRLVLFDADGLELPPQNGHFWLQLWRGDTATGADVDVVEGVWSAGVEDEASITGVSVSDLTCGALRPKLIEPADIVPFPASRELVIRARIPRETILRVVDAATGVDLSGVAIVDADVGAVDDLEHPGIDHVSRNVGADLRSPIRVGELSASPPIEHTWKVLVGARDYAWQAVSLDVGQGGERRIALQRGGELEIDVVGSLGTPGAKLRARRPGAHAPHVEIALVDGKSTYALAGLAPGPLELRAEVGEFWREPIGLGGVDVEIRAGERVRASMRVHLAPKVELAHAAGRVLLPAAWNPDRGWISLDLLGTSLDGSKSHRHLQCTRAESADPQVVEYHWSVPRLQVGRYELAFSDPPFSKVIDVPAGGRDDYELSVPPPAELHLLILDATTGEEVVSDRVHWYPRRPEGVSGGGLERAQHDPSGRGYRIRAPSTAIVLHISPWSHIPQEVELDLAVGVREHTVRLEPACGFVMIFRDGETPIAMPEDWFPAPTCVGGQGQQSMTSMGGFERKVMVTAPGTYEIEIPKVAGYHQPPKATIEVTARQFTDVVIQLERENP